MQFKLQKAQLLTPSGGADFCLGLANASSQTFAPLTLPSLKQTMLQFLDWELGL